MASSGDLTSTLRTPCAMLCRSSAKSWRSSGTASFRVFRQDDTTPSCASMSMTPARRKQVLFTNKYETTTSSFVARKGTFTDTSAEALKGKRIGVQRGSSQNSWLVDNGYDKSASLVLYDDTRQPELDLISGRIDLMMLDKPTLVTDFLNTAPAKDFGFVGKDVVVGNGNAIAVRLSDTDLCDRLNKALATIIANGTYAKINNKYFPFPLL